MQHPTTPTTPIYCRYSGIQIGATPTIWPQESSWHHQHPVFGLKLHQLQKLTQRGHKTVAQRNLLLLAYCHACLPKNLHQSEPATFNASFLNLHFYPATSILPQLSATPADHALWQNLPHLRITGSNPASNGKQLADWLADCIFPAISKYTSIMDDLESADNSTLTALWLSDHTARKANKTDTLAAVWDYALAEIRATFGIPNQSLEGLSIALFRSQLANPTDSKTLEILATMLGGISAVASSVYNDKLGISARQIEQARIDLSMKQAIIRDRVVAHKKGISKLVAPVAAIDLSNFSTAPAVETLEFSFTSSITVELEQPAATAATPKTSAQDQYAGLKPELVALLKQQELQATRLEESRNTAISAAITRRFGDIDLSNL